MNPTTRAAVVSELWGDVGSSNVANQRLFLAHYTTLDCLEKMMFSNEIWFSHPFLMNDHEEVRFGINEGTRGLLNDIGLQTALGSDARHQSFISRFMFWRNHYDQNFVFDTYVFCLSRHDIKSDDGRLSMWRGYGGDGTGAAIVFDTSKLNAVATSPLIIDKVEYLSTADRLKWLADFLSKLGRVSKPLTEPDLDELAKIAFERLTLAAIFSKHKGFNEEDEYRAVYMPERDPKGDLHPFFGHHNGPRGLEPKFKLKVEPLPGVFADDLSLEKLIHHVILGPSRASPLVHGSAARMLVAAGKPALAKSLAMSQIPYRSTLR